MTTREIAESVGKDYSTVSRWIEKVSCNMQEIYCKVQEAKKTSKPADYDSREVAAIIAQGMGDDVAGAFKVNATYAEMERQAASRPAVKPARLPSGAQINAMARLYGDLEARKRVDFAMGYVPTGAEVTTIAIAENVGRLSRQAYAVEMKNREQAENKDRINKMTPELFK